MPPSLDPQSPPRLRPLVQRFRAQRFRAQRFRAQRFQAQRFQAQRFQAQRFQNPRCPNRCLRRQVAVRGPLQAQPVQCLKLRQWPAQVHRRKHATE